MEKNKNKGCILNAWHLHCQARSLSNKKHLPKSYKRKIGSTNRRSACNKLGGLEFTAYDCKVIYSLQTWNVRLGCSNIETTNFLEILSRFED
jgi:hypothetical protein